MRRVFLGIVTAINPTDTSAYASGRNEVTIVAHSVAEMGDCNSTFKPSLTHEETRDLGALFGKRNAVRITVETGEDTPFRRALTHLEAAREALGELQPDGEMTAADVQDMLCSNEHTLQLLRGEEVTGADGSQAHAADARDVLSPELAAVAKEKLSLLLDDEEFDV